MSSNESVDFTMGSPSESMNAIVSSERIVGFQQQTTVPPTSSSVNMIQSYPWQPDGSSLGQYDLDPSEGIQYRDIRGLGARSRHHDAPQDERQGEPHSLVCANEPSIHHNIQQLWDYGCPDVALFDSALTANAYLKSASSWVSDDGSDEYDKENQCVYRENSDRSESYGGIQSNENDYGSLNPSPAFSDDEMQG